MGIGSISTRDHVDGLQLRIVSFGFGHGPAPAADLVLDLREWFRDPHVSPELRALTGRDPRVIANVLSTRGAGDFIDRIFNAIATLVDLRLGTVVLATGCSGGRHRSTVVSDQLFLRALSAGWTAEVHHRDIDKPVLTSPPQVHRGRPRVGWWAVTNSGCRSLKEVKRRPCRLWQTASAAGADGCGIRKCEPVASW